LPFSKFARRPIAVGSIAQVHRAELVSGERVIVKLVRPGLQREIDRDLNAAELLVDLLLKIPGYARKRTRVAISHALRDLGAALRNEVDLRREATSLEEFGRRLRANPRVHVPAVYREWCSGRALVMEELIGEPLTAYRARAKTDPDGARRVADLEAQTTGGHGDGPGGPNRLETFVSDLFRVAYRHGLYVPPSATLLIKAIVTIEGVARSLNPNLNVVATAVPIVLSSLRPQWL